MSDNPGPENSRWHLAQDMFLEALEAAMRFPGVFLKTTVSGGGYIFVDMCIMHVMRTNSH